MTGRERPGGWQHLNSWVAISLERHESGRSMGASNWITGLARYACAGRTRRVFSRHACSLMSMRRLIAAALLLALLPSNWSSLCELNCDSAPSRSAIHGRAHRHMHHAVAGMENCGNCLSQETESITAGGCEHSQVRAVSQSRFFFPKLRFLSILARVPEIVGRNNLHYREHAIASASAGGTPSPPITPLRI
jgi:hypothetical protein